MVDKMRVYLSPDAYKVARKAVSKAIRGGSRKGSYAPEEISTLRLASAELSTAQAVIVSD